MQGTIRSRAAKRLGDDETKLQQHSRPPSRPSWKLQRYYYLSEIRKGGRSILGTDLWVNCIQVRGARETQDSRGEMAAVAFRLCSAKFLLAVKIPLRVVPRYLEARSRVWSTSFPQPHSSAEAGGEALRNVASSIPSLGFIPQPSTP